MLSSAAASLNGLFEHPASLHPDRFNHLHIFGTEGELFSLEIIFHMLWAQGFTPPRAHLAFATNLQESCGLEEALGRARFVWC